MSIRKGSQIIAGLSNIDSINNQNPNSSIPTIYDWIGTLQEYTTQDIANTHPEWVCFVLNDSQGGADVYSKSETDALLDKKLGYEYLTNCLTKIPQDITVELENSVLTLKANSKIYVNNVAEVVPNDLSLVSKSGTFNEVVVVIDNNGTYELKSVNKDTSVYVQSNEPSDITEIIWFNINTGNFKYYDENAIAYTCSLPICECIINTSVRTNINNVFNGYGRLGKIFFLLPDVEGLCTNGRNEDGQLKSIKFTNTTLKILVVDDATKHYIIVDQHGDLLNYRSYYNNSEPSSLSVYESTYINRENIIVVKNTTGYEVVSGVYLGDLNNLQISTTFRAANYSDIDQKQDKLTAGANISISNSNVISAVSTTYTAGSNVNIDNSNVISAIDTTYTAGDNISIDSLNNNKIAVKEVVTYDNISNCIINVPQDIKLELSNGTLTLKAGSKVYMPNGTGMFDAYTVTVDISQSSTIATSDGSVFVFWTNIGLQLRNISKVSSGPNEPTITLFSGWYDTTNNLVKLDASGTAWQTTPVSFPIAIVTVFNGAISSIEQVFNGFGYIGSTVFALPGVEGLISNGRNEDGSLNNIPVKIKDVTLGVIPDNNWNIWNIYLRKDGTILRHPIYVFYESESEPTIVTETALWYNPLSNIMHWTQDYGLNWNPVDALKIMDCRIRENQRIISCNMKKPYQAVDDNEFQKLKKRNIEYKHISNCITYVPEDIKVYIGADNKLYLDIASKLYIPDGLYASGDRKFTTFTTVGYYACSTIDNRVNSLLTYNTETNSINPWQANDVYSGTTMPSGTNNVLWYNPTTNECKARLQQQWYKSSLPFASANSTSTGGWTSISHVFNGIGYVGATSFVLPGVKYLVPKGRNQDGSLNSVEYTVDKVFINNGISNGVARTTNDYLILDTTDIGTVSEHELSTDYYPAISSSTWHLVYDSKKNQYFRTSYGTMYEKVSVCDCHILVYRDSTDGRIKDISGNISTFKAVNYNDYIANKVIYYENPTESNGYTWFRLYGNGWVEQGGRKIVFHDTVTTVNLPIPMKTREYAAQVSSAHLDYNTGGGYGTICTLSINGKSSTQVYLYSFSLEGSMIISSWEVKGLSAII